MKIEVKIPSIAESITEVTLGRWLVRHGDYVKIDQPICEVETDKASQELIAEKAGEIEIIAKEGDDIKVGGLIALIDASAKPSISAAQSEMKDKSVAESPTKEISASNEDQTKHYASHTPSPSARKLIEEYQLSIEDISGKGKNQRITKSDVLEVIDKKISTKTEDQSMANRSFSRHEETKNMSRIRKVISERLVHAKNSTAMLTTFNEVNMKPIMDIRTKYKDKFNERHGVGLGFMSFFAKASSIALMKYPDVNAYLDITKGEIIYHSFADISIAVSTPKGLVVPVIRNAESLSLAELEKAIAELATKGRAGNLSMDEMEGGSFTITNGGVFGSMLSTPILNPPQSAILGMHKIEERPIAENGHVVIRPMMYLALSYDHRIIDGKESVGFLVMIKELLEHPERMLTGLDPIESLLML